MCSCNRRAITRRRRTQWCARGYARLWNLLSTCSPYAPVHATTCWCAPARCTPARRRAGTRQLPAARSAREPHNPGHRANIFLSARFGARRLSSLGDRTAGMPATCSSPSARRCRSPPRINPPRAPSQPQRCVQSFWLLSSTRMRVFPVARVAATAGACNGPVHQNRRAGATADLARRGCQFASRELHPMCEPRTQGESSSTPLCMSALAPARKM